MAANAKDAKRAAGGSDRLVKTIGIAPPRTSPAARPPPNQTIDLNKILPDTMSGTTRPSATPATGPSKDFIATAFGDIARSNDSGPAKSASVSMAAARKAISAASPLDGIAGKTDSVADKTAIRGRDWPRRRLISAICNAASTRVSMSGATLTAASLIIKGRPPAGGSMANKCTSRLPVRRPAARFTMPPINTSV